MTWELVWQIVVLVILALFALSVTGIIIGAILSATRGKNGKQEETRPRVD